MSTVLNSSKFIKWFAFPMLWLPHWASASGADSWEVNGFATQGFFYSDHNNIYGQSEDGSLDFRELAVNGVWQTDNLFFASQLMSRRAGEAQDGSPQVDYALFDYRFAESIDGRAGIRVGRIKNPFGFYNETRDVAFTRPSILLAQAVYFDNARDLLLSSDGVSLYGSRYMEHGWLDMDLLFGKPNTETTVEYAYLSRDWPGEFNDSNGFMWRTVYNTSDQRWRLGFTMGRFNLEYNADEAALAALPLPTQMIAPQDGHIDIDAYLLSAQFNLEHWSFTAELSRQKVNWGTLDGIFATDPENRFESGYLQAEYRISPNWTLMARYEELYLDIEDRDGRQAEAILGKPAHTQFAKDLILGVGWQPDPQWSFRAEWHKVRGTAWLPEQDNPDQNALRKNWNLFALQATYRF
ncbi:TonB-dependent receptor [Pontibacterium granulatum]|uniref:porin n=1 Tax=Pontibacterium granulatum TaxID=2036029 RepID=UPI00249B122D|nr:TonB-dependent receptor [Pontibacterium granulatum]MDI3325409.1 TonB-dependent receptor [Pontibacterium granulatum]